MLKKILFVFLLFIYMVPGFAKEAEKQRIKIKSLFDYDSQLFLFYPKDYNPFNYRPFDPSMYSFVEEPGKAEQIGGMYFDESTKKYLILSKNFLDLNTNLFVLNNLNIQNVEDLKKYEIGVVKGDFALEFLKKKYPELKLRIFDSYEELVYRAVRGEIAVFAQNFPTAMLFLSKYRALNYFKQFRLFFPESDIQQQEMDLKELLQNDKKIKENKRTASKKKNLKKQIEEESEEPEEKQPESKEKLKEEQSVQKQETPAPVIIVEEKFPISLLILLIFIPVLLAAGMTYLFFHRKRKKNFGKTLKKLQEKDWKKILSGGENDSVEFKSSLRWDYKTEQINPVLEYVAAKTISAFLNSEGGWLFIGVDDDGKILGLEKDYQVLNKKNKDGFILKLTELINDYLGKETHQYIKINTQSIEDKEIAAVQILLSKKPVFVKNKNKEEFFIRTGASCQSMGLKEAHEYITSHWG